MKDTPAAAYAGSNGRVEWSGVHLSADRVQGLCDGKLQERLFDQTYQDAAIAQLQALATSDMATQTISQLLSSQPQPLDWEIGEALAEVLLQEHHFAAWPGNSARDRRTPQASLPGADLVGFVQDEKGTALLFGEVKTSSDLNCPPNVVYGRSGLIHQLENLATQRRLHFVLLKWLSFRCLTDEHKEMYTEAARRYIESKSLDFHLVGCLMRDTAPNELDLQARALALSGKLASPTRARLISWYFPSPVSEWPTWVEVVQ
jgi:hypothetical protein